MSVRPIRSRSIPSPADWFPDFPSIMNLRPLFDTHLIKVEDERTDDKYIVYAELPGLDPAKDIRVSVQDGLLTIKAERGERKESKGRSEFSYGTFVRTLSLPPEVDEDKIEAGYKKGILTVTVPLTDTRRPDEKRVEIEIQD